MQTGTVRYIAYYMEYSNWRIIFWPTLLLFFALVWGSVFFNNSSESPEIYFLDVGQGDSELLVLNNKVKILIDGGPNSDLSKKLANILPRFNNYIDLIILSHPQLDHFGGFLDLIKRYKIGAFIYSGEDNNTQSFQNLKKALQEKNIPIIILKEKDKISYLGDRMEMLWPPQNFSEEDVNEETLVVKFISENGLSVLFTGDIGIKTEEKILKQHDVKADILKVPHHGSKNSSSANFLREVSPKVSVIEVGKNSYGHPTKEVLNRLAQVKSQIFRTDQNGTLKIVLNGEKLNIFAQN